VAVCPLGHEVVVMVVMPVVMPVGMLVLQRLVLVLMVV
jgi:hypothetical protein